MRTNLQRFLVLLLCLCMMLGAVVLPVGAAGPGNTNVFDGDSATYHTVRLSAGGTYSYRAIVNTSFTAFNMQLATGSNTLTGSCTIGVYAWQGNHAATLASGALREQSFTITNNGLHEVSFLDAPLPAGEYLFHVSNPVDNVLIWTDTPNSGATSKGYVYTNGVESRGDDPKLMVKLAESVDVPFGTCEPTVSGYTPLSDSGSATYTFPALNTATDAYGYRAQIGASFDKFKTRIRSSSDAYAGISLRVEIYAWTHSYARTVQSEPVYSTDYTLTSKDHTPEFDIGRALPAGEYLFLLSNAEGNVSFINDPPNDGSAAKGFNYVNGVENRNGNLQLNIHLVEGSTAPFGVCEATKSAASKDVHDGGAAITKLTAHGSYGYRANLLSPFTGFGIHLYSTAYAGAGCTVSVYAWLGEFATTIAAEPIFEEKNYRYTSGNYTPQFQLNGAQPAGEYLFLISNPVGDARIVADAVNEGGTATGLNYVNGVEQPGNIQMNVTFEATTDGYYGVCQASFDASTAVPAGTHPVWQSTSGNQYAHSAAITEGYGYRTVVGAPFTSFTYQMAKGTSCTFGVYRWDTDYATTVAAGALYTASKTIAKENELLTLDWEEALPAGEYLFLISDPVGEVKVLTEHPTKYPAFAEQTYGCYYADGVEKVGVDPKLQIKTTAPTGRVFGLMQSYDIAFRGHQVSLTMAEDTASTFSLRFAASIDSLAYENVGIEVLVTEAAFYRQWTSCTKNVYSSLYATTSKGDALSGSMITAEELGGRYIVAMTVRNVPKATDLSFVVRPYVTHMDGTKEYGKVYKILVTKEGVVTSAQA